jgi:hypothetical protein
VLSNQPVQAVREFQAVFGFDQHFEVRLQDLLECFLMSRWYLEAGIEVV